MKVNFEYRRYRRPFRHPLETARGAWMAREGLLIALRDGEGRRGFGEIAPIEAFGTETLDQAETFFRNGRGNFDSGDAESIPETLPCCRFAVECALNELRGDGMSFPHDRLPVAGLLPAGSGAVSRARELWEEGYRTLKWKIGVHSFGAERDWFRRLRDTVPAGVRWRLDANGGLDPKAARRWAAEVDNAGVEFLEQPLPVQSENELDELGADFPVPIALDESVGNVGSLRKWIGHGWTGVFVIKPSLAGSPSALLEILSETGARCVFSSALETAIGMKGALRVAFAAGNGRSAVGWGAGVFPDDGLSSAPLPEIAVSCIRDLDTEEVWRRVSQ